MKYNRWYIEFIFNSIKEKEEKVEKLQTEIRLFERERQRIIESEL